MLDHKEGKTIQSVQRAVDIINCFNDVRIELSLSEISRILDLNKSTVHGIINTLCNNGFIRQNSDGKYLLGQVLLNKFQYTRSTNKLMLMTTAKPYMIKLSNKYKVTSNLFIIDDGKLLFLHQVLPVNSSYVISQVSDNDPLYCMASGKIALLHMPKEMLNDYLEHTEIKPTSEFTIRSREALMANLRQIKENGYSYENEELSEGVSAIAVPIYDNETELFGTLSVTGVAFHIAQGIEEMAADLKQISQIISGQLQ